MEDLIRRSEAIDTLTRLEPSFRGSVLEQALKNMPSAQSEIVRCGDCKHYIEHYCYESNHIRIGLFVHDDAFCAWAERRIDE